MSSRVILRGNSDVFYKEGNNTDALLTPGHLVMEVSTSITTASPSGQSYAPVNTVTVARQTQVGRAPATVALEDFWLGGDINAVWPVNSAVNYVNLENGHVFNAIVAPYAPAISFGQYLESAGDGTVRAVSEAGDKASITINSGVSNGGITLTAVQGGNAGNGITITINAASSANVTVTDTNIVVTPASGSTSATAVLAQIAGNAAAAGLVTGVVVGTGAGLVPAIASTNLTGGQDGGAANAQFIARAALNNSASATAARLRVEVVS